jgi:hypothetical protein
MASPLQRLTPQALTRPAQLSLTAHSSAHKLPEFDRRRFWQWLQCAAFAQHGSRRLVVASVDAASAAAVTADAAVLATGVTGAANSQGFLKQ